MTGSIWKRAKRRLKARFNHDITTPADRRRSMRYAHWMDVGFLRTKWTNDGEVVGGVLRSNNPTHTRFEAYAARGVQTVLNLRNDTHLAPVKFAQESCEALGLTYVSFPMAPRRVPTRDELLDLIALFPTLQKPVLIHCKSGADRTGLAAAIWLLTQENAPLEEAQKELSLRYLHRRESETGVLDVVLDQFGEALAGTDFADWVRTSYDPQTAKTRALAEKPKRGKWAELRAIMGDLYRYAQYREARWHKSFETPIETAEDEKRANFFMKWVDHGVLRGFWTNRAEVADGVIRSNHPTVQRFHKEAENGIRTIVNLRGASQQPQYLLEQKQCADLSLTLIDLPMNATRAPRKEVLLALLDTFDMAQRPLLMHCKSGADRTGLAAALFVLTQGGTMDAARAQLSPRFLHFRRGKKAVLDAVLDDYAAHSDLSVRIWITDHYDPAAF